MAPRVATGLLVVSLILLLVYGADVAVASFSPQRQGFLPFDEAVRGVAFGGGAVIMSIIAFVIARKEYAAIVSALLFVNGGLIIAGMIALVVQGSVASEDTSSILRSIGSTIAMGALLIGLGAWKHLTDKKILASRRKEPAQK
jgi:protein-S-isoprenylcysteine O-methyltransferase Ste14